MKELLEIAIENMILGIQAMALVVVAFGTLQAFITAIRQMFSPAHEGNRFQHAYIRYARWLVTGLTFQLAADIIATALSPNWEEIGHLAAISVIRTFLNYFLERDMAAIEEREAAAAKSGRVVP
jgi:uncharacterized membrane protein